MKRKDYEKKAEEAVRSFIDDGDTLQDSIVKIAHRDSLNPEQIKRVIEMANTGAFLELFKKTAGLEDRVVDFEVADPSKTIDAFYGSHPESSEKVAFDTSDYANHYFADVIDENEDHTPQLEKVASQEEPEIAVEDPRKIQEEEIRSWKMASILQDRMANAEYSSRDIADKIAQNFRGIYSRDKYASFEKDAFALYGNEATYVSQAIRKRLGMSPLKGVPDNALVKSASEFHVVDASSPFLKEAGEYIGHVKEFVVCGDALNLLTSREKLTYE